nr:hypothetical protein BaRGS_030602 [Batillaria attramentaria]KAG5708459.1 hypothetical protein BaRGS_026186 [Batillaria attramentaria]
MSDNENEKVDVKSVEDLRRTVAQLQVQLETDRKRLASSQRTENSTVFLSDQRRIARFTDRPQEPGDVSLQDWLDDIRAAITFRDKIEAVEKDTAFSKRKNDIMKERLAEAGLDVPFLGYVELDVTIMDKTLPSMAFLVVRDPQGSMADRKRRVPGVLGSNILRQVKLLGGMDHPESSLWQGVSALYEELATSERAESHVKPTGRRPVRIPARSLKVITCTTRPVAPGKHCDILIEPSERLQLPAGIGVGRCIVRVDGTGIVPVQVANISDKDVYLRPYVPIACAFEADAPSPFSVTVTQEEILIEETDIQPTVQDFTRDVLSEVSVGDGISEDQRRRLFTVLNKYEHTFSRGEDDLGFCDLIHHRIVTTDDTAVKVPHRRIPPQYWSDVRDYLQNALKQGIIRESSSPYASQCVIARKKNGKIRFCVDYRGLNAKTHKDAYPLPRIEEALDVLKGATYFCSLDLAHGFNQIPVAEEDMEKTAFRVGTGGLYEYTRMAFGLCNAPATFMRVMDKIFGDQNFQTLLIYVDDLLVFGKTFEETLERLELVLSRLSKNNLKAQPSKCNLFFNKLRYLGHLVTPEGILPDPDKVSAVTNWQEPTSEKDLRAFLGLTGYYRRFVPKYAQVAAPLHALLNKTQGSGRRKGLTGWNQHCSEAFQELKRRLTTAPVLGYPDFTRPYVLEIDASFQGLGAVLSQEQDGRKVVIGYASRGLREKEHSMRRYSSMKLELLALRWAITEKFRDLLQGTNFVVYTDNNPLSYIQTSAKLGASETRWAAELANFDFTVKYRSGHSNRNADALSRREIHVEQLMAECDESQVASTPIPAGITDAIADLTPDFILQEVHVREKQDPAPSTLPAADLSKLQEHDPVINRIRQLFRTGHKPTRRQAHKETPQVRKILRHWHQLKDRNGTLCRAVHEDDIPGPEVNHIGKDVVEDANFK